MLGTWGGAFHLRFTVHFFQSEQSQCSRLYLAAHQSMEISGKTTMAFCHWPMDPRPGGSAVECVSEASKCWWTVVLTFDSGGCVCCWLSDVLCLSCYLTRIPGAQQLVQKGVNGVGRMCALARVCAGCACRCFCVVVRRSAEGCSRVRCSAAVISAFVPGAADSPALLCCVSLPHAPSMLRGGGHRSCQRASGLWTKILHRCVNHCMWKVFAPFPVCACGARGCARSVRPASSPIAVCGTAVAACRRHSKGGEWKPCLPVVSPAVVRVVRIPPPKKKESHDPSCPLHLLTSPIGLQLQSGGALLWYGADFCRGPGLCGALPHCATAPLCAARRVAIARIFFWWHRSVGW